MSYQINDVPNDITACNSLARMIDGILFRYYWATEELTNKEYDFRPSEGSMNMTELNLHIYDLAYTTYKTFGGKASYEKSSLNSFAEARASILDLYEQCSALLKTLKDADLNTFHVAPRSVMGDFPFWYVINGQIADCLTHIGQITSWRRIAGNPQPKVSVFLGKEKVN